MSDSEITGQATATRRKIHARPLSLAPSAAPGGDRYSLSGAAACPAFFWMNPLSISPSLENLRRYLAHSLILPRLPLTHPLQHLGALMRRDKTPWPARHPRGLSPPDTVPGAPSGLSRGRSPVSGCKWGMSADQPSPGGAE